MLAEHAVGGIEDQGAAGSRIGTLTLHGLFSDRNVRNGSRSGDTGMRPLCLVNEA
jgi:hypothetical protein